MNIIEEEKKYRALVFIPFNKSYQLLEPRKPGNEWLRTNIPCQATCPAHTDVSTYVNLVSHGRFDEAYLVNRRDNVFPGILGRICARPCEGACRRHLKDEPVAICSLKRSTSDYRHDHLLPNKPPVTRAERIAIVGAGPSGLACARDLRLRGYPVKVYDAMPEPGGMLVGGIPAWRLPRAVIREEVDHYMDALGVEFQLNTRIGDQTSVKDLMSDYDAVYLAPGCQNPVKLKLPGEELEGFEYGLPWLEKINLPPQAQLDLTGKRVVVIGAGYSAIDCCRTALRLGAEEVFLCYRRTQREAPLEEEEIEEAEKEGIKFIFLVSPVAVVGENGKVTGVQFIHNRLAEPDAQGRRKPEPVPGSEFIIPCEVVLPATGQESDISWLPEELKKQIKEQGKLIVNPNTWMTRMPGLFAGGDFVSGPRNVISAIADGHKVALAIHQYLSGEELPEPIGTLEKVAYKRRELSYLKLERQEMSYLPPTERLSEDGENDPVEKEVAQGFPKDTTLQEAKRCLKCVHNITIDEQFCTLCGVCEEICPEKVIHLRPLADLSTEGEQQPGAVGAMTIVLDESSCVRCGQCVAECPTRAIQMGRFCYFDPSQHWYVGVAGEQLLAGASSPKN